jgi:hypothetical protein
MDADPCAIPKSNPLKTGSYRKRDLHKFGIYFAVTILLTGCLPTWSQLTLPSPTPGLPTHSPTIDRALLTTQYAITEIDNGKTFMYVVTSRFSVDLDKYKHPLKDLAMEQCPLLGFVFNLSLNGPCNYSIGFEVIQKGSCWWGNGDFQVRIGGVGGP